MTDAQNSITPSRLKTMLPGFAHTCFGDDLLIARTQIFNNENKLGYPFKIDCFLAVYCLEGRIKCHINLTEYTMESGTLLLIMPGNIVKLSDSTRDLRVTIICASKSYISGIGVDLGKILSEAVEVMRDPCLKLSPDETSIMSRYLDLIDIINSTSNPYMEESVRGVTASVFYQFAGFMANSSIVTENLPQANSRQKQIFEGFVKLALANHAEEHMVGFYADKLCLTPKYLSKIVREVSGKSAPEWINDLIMLDAKNMLRHSKLSIKEISSRLNFQSQSFFFRFFKEHTGLTPSQYRDE